jgi:hypothetical protein
MNKGIKNLVVLFMVLFIADVSMAVLAEVVVVDDRIGR